MFDDSDRLLSVFKSKYSVGHRHLVWMSPYPLLPIHMLDDAPVAV